VYLHLKRALTFSLERMGVHGMPVGLHADWNDCLRLGAKGESLFVAFQLYMAYRTFIEIAERKQQTDDVAWAQGLLAELDKSIQEHAWEEDQFVRGFTEDNYTVGSRYNEEASVWLNPQSWAVLSGAARPEQAELAMNRVHDNLKTDYGTMLFYPPFKKYGMPVALMTMLGHGNRAFDYFRNCSPASMNDQAEVRKIEPYVHGQFVEGKDSPYFGRAHVHWLTGTASTVMVSLTEGIMGVQPEFDGLRLNPCVPSEWKEFSMVREFRGKLLTIAVNNPNGVEHGVTSITVNGQEIAGDFIPEHLLREENDVRVRMG
jgi:cellobiose phosphorylase